MKVLQILPELNAGGVERGVIELSRYLVAQGHSSVVVSNGGRLVSVLEEDGARHRTLAVHRKSFQSFLQVRPLRRILEQEQPDVLHLRSRLPAWIAWWAWRKLDPGTRPRLVTTVHGFYSVNPYSAIMMRGERVIAVSESIREYILKNYPQTPLEVIRLIPRGIDPVECPRGFKPTQEWERTWRAEFPQMAGQSVLVLPGRITRLKGHEDFIDLVAKLVKAGQPVHGLIVGGAHPKKLGYLAELKTLAAQFGADDAITFTGHRNDYREIAAVADVIFSLSTQPESFGRTTLEALALGRPVVGYDHGGVGEQLHKFYPEGRVPLRDKTALLETTQRILKASGTPSAVEAPYTLTAMCEATLDTYRELLRSGPASVSPTLAS